MSDYTPDTDGVRASYTTEPHGMWQSRKEIEALLGMPVYLDIHVKVAKDWQKDPKQLRRLGF